jgi:hypothetical protein
MDEKNMWKHLRVLGGHVDEETFEQLVAELCDLSGPQIVAFSEALAAVLYRLDTAAHFHQPVRDISDPPGSPVLPMTDDMFLFVRCAVVAAGRKRYEAVLANPSALAGTWDVSDAQLLLEAAPQAYEEVTGHPWAHETAVSPDTGSNTEGWPESESTPTATKQVKTATPQDWLKIPVGWDGVKPSAPFEYFLDQTVKRVAAEPRWTEWFFSLGVEEVWLFPLYTTQRADPKIRKGRRKVQAEFTRTPDEIWRPGLTDEENAEVEVRELLQSTYDALATGG